MSAVDSMFIAVGLAPSPEVGYKKSRSWSLGLEASIPIALAAISRF